jgi:hypothetical protein
MREEQQQRNVAHGTNSVELTENRPDGVSESTELPKSSTHTKPDPMMVVPPEPSTEPSGLVMALLRLADLEAQMEYEHVKLQQLSFQQVKIRSEYNVLEKMAVGIASYQKDYDQYVSSKQLEKEQETGTVNMEATHLSDIS